MRPVLWQDFETGGLDEKVHSPLSFAMMATRGDEIIGEWECNIRQDPLVVTQEALRVNKIDLCEDGLSFDLFKKNYFHRVNDWFYGGSNGQSTYPNIKPNKDNMPYYGGQNTFFDRPWLHRILGTSYDGCYYHRRDLMVLADPLRELGFIKCDDLKLASICKALGVEAEGEFHSALTDVKATFKCWLKLQKILDRMNLVERYEKIFLDIENCVVTLPIADKNDIMKTVIDMIPKISGSLNE